MDIRDTPEQAELRRIARRLARELGPSNVMALGDPGRRTRLAGAVRDTGWLELRHGTDEGAPLASGVEAAIIAEASLSFLGLGQQPPAPSWGSMLNAAQRYLSQAPWMALYPGLMIFGIVMALNVLGDGLRDVLDPRYQ